MASQILSSAVLLASLSCTALGQFTSTPIVPPSYPLAVRSPYLSTWLPGLSASNLPTAVPQFWRGQSLGWGVLVKVGNATYSLLGVPDSMDGVTAATTNSAEFTSTHTTFNLSAGDASIGLDFLSPVSPSNYFRQSFPFSYLTVSVSSPSNAPVQVYVDIDEAWTGQNTATVSNFTSTDTLSAFQLSVDGAYMYSELDDMALWGTAVLAAPKSDATTLTGQIGDASMVRSRFAGSGTLNGTDATFASGNVVAISQDLGTVTATSVTFAVGYVREQAINYLGNARTGYYRSKYADTISALDAFFADYNDANTESLTIDSTIEARGSATAGTNYSTILALGTRQTFGGLDLTIPEDTLDTDDFLVFLKEISSDGNVNTMDVIFPAFPQFYVMNPEYIRLLLEPVVQYLASGRWKQPFVIHDIGSTYPNATGHDDEAEEDQPIEETGNLMMLVDAYTRATGDTSFATQYASLFQGYANYLVANGINIASQLSTDDGAGPLANQTNLAIKAAVGLVAYGDFSGNANYSAVGRRYADMLYNQGLGTDAAKTHFTLAYGDDATYSTVFNLYEDVLLQLGTFPAAAYAMQTAFYPTVRAAAGVPLDSRVPWSKTDWMLFAAAYCTDDATRAMFVDDVYAFIDNQLPVNQVPFSDRFYVTGDRVGQFYDFRARPVSGGEYAILALTDVAIFARLGPAGQGVGPPSPAPRPGVRGPPATSGRPGMKKRGVERVGRRERIEEGLERVGGWR